MKKDAYATTRAACYIGYLSQAVAINFAPLLFLIFEATFGISLAAISLLIALNFLVQWLTDLASARFLGTLNTRTLLIVAHLLVAGGLACLATLPFILPPLLGLALASMLCGCGGGLIEVLTSPVMAALPQKTQGVNLCFLHAFYCWGQAGTVLLSVLFFALFGTAKWQALSLLLSLVPLLGALLFLTVPLVRPESAHGGGAVWRLLSQKSFLLLAAMIALSGALEMIMGQWASGFAEAALGVGKTVGDLLGPFLFALLMGLSRALGTRIKDHGRLLVMLTLSALLCALSYFLAALSPLPLMALAACGICGLSVGLLWPGVYTLAADTHPSGGVPLFAMLALAGDVGCLLGPSLAGAVASLHGGDLRYAFLLTAALPLLLLLCLFELREKKKRQRT